MKNIVIIWGNGLNKLELVKRKILESHEIKSVYKYQWKDGLEFEGLSKFYNKNNKIIRTKIKNCATQNFVLINIEGKSKYGMVLHREDIIHVDLNVFNLKKELRHIYDNKDLIHTADSSQEAEFQKSLIKTYCNLVNENYELINNIFEKISEENYVILRNDISLKDDIFSDGGDIDILCENSLVLVSKLNLVGDKRYKSRYFYKSKDIVVQFDIRDIYSNYYDANWGKQILSKKIYKNGYYIPDNEDHVYSFLYHIFFHKRKIRYDHVSYLNHLLKEYNFKLDNPIIDLVNYMTTNSFSVVIPHDRSVPMNINLINQYKLYEKIPLYKTIDNLKFKLKQRVKRFVKENS